MSRTTDTRRDKTRARPPAIVKVNRKRTERGGGSCAAPNASAFHSAKILRTDPDPLFRRFTNRTPDRKIFSRLLKIPRRLLPLVANPPWKKSILPLPLLPFSFPSSLLYTFFPLSFIFISLLLVEYLGVLLRPPPLPPGERSLTRAFYVRRARFSAVIDTTSGGIPLESIELIQPGDFNLMRNAGRARDLVKFKDMPRNGWITQYCRR